MLPRLVEAWRARGETVRSGGRDVFVVDTAPSGGAEAVLVLHGFPSSSLDFHRVMGGFGDRRVLLFDAPGFGFSDKSKGGTYSLFEAADVACDLAKTRALSRVHVVAHDMGTSVACELLARRERGLLPFEVASVLFFNGSVFVEMTHLTPSQRLLRTPLATLFARLSSYRTFVAQMRRICGRPLPADELDAMWASIRHDDGHLRLPDTIGYVDERWRYRPRWIPPLSRLDVPSRVVWGPEDTVAVMGIGERLAATLPGARLVRLERLGHYPMLEDPAVVEREIAAWMGEVAPM
jgi:pimeloyl-ACP methyl ester carboxylesterase